MAEAAAGAPAEAAELTTQWEALQLQQRHAEQLLQRQATLLERAGNGAKPAAGEVGDADAARETLRSQRADWERKDARDEARWAQRDAERAAQREAAEREG